MELNSCQTGVDMSNKQIYSSLSDNMHVGILSYKHQETSEYSKCNTNLTENVAGFQRVD